jgi:hypothetical protein
MSAALLAVLLWVLLGYFLLYNGQSQMKRWYEMEANIHDTETFLELVERYNNIYKQYEQ